MIYDVHIDFARLGIQCLIAALVVVAAFYRGSRTLPAGETSAQLTTKRKVALPLSALCLIASIFLLKDDARSQIMDIYGPKPPPPIKGPVLYAIKDIPAGTTVTAGMVEVLQIEQIKIPMDALSSLDQALGHKATKKLESGQIIPKKGLSF